MAEFSASPILNDSSWEFGAGDAYKGAVKKSTCFKYLMVQIITHLSRAPLKYGSLIPRLLNRGTYTVSSSGKFKKL